MAQHPWNGCLWQGCTRPARMREGSLDTLRPRPHTSVHQGWLSARKPFTFLTRFRACFFARWGLWGRRRGMSIGRLIAAIAWLAVASWYWWGQVPLAPCEDDSAGSGFDVLGWTPDGGAVLCRIGLDQHGIGIQRYGGPVEVRRFPEGLVESSVLGIEDTFDSVLIMRLIDFKAGLACVAGGNGNLRIVDFRTARRWRKFRTG